MGAEIGYGMLVKVEATPGSGTFATVGKQSNIKGNGWSVDAVETTHTESPDKVREKIAGLVTMKPTGFEIQYSLGGAEEQTLISLRGLTRKFRTVHPTGKYAEYDAFISDFDPDMPTDGKSMASIELELAGALTLFADGSGQFGAAGDFGHAERGRHADRIRGALDQRADQFLLSVEERWCCDCRRDGEHLRPAGQRFRRCDYGHGHRHEFGRQCQRNERGGYSSIRGGHG